jgi:hypothetical protein
MIDNGQYGQLEQALWGTASAPSALQSALSLNVASMGAVNTGVQSYLAAPVANAGQPIVLDLADGDGMVSSQSYGLADRLDQAWVLGSPGSQPLANGGVSADPTFDYWTESVEL